MDLSRRPSVATPEAQGAAASVCEAKDQGLCSLSKPATDHLRSAEEFVSNERMKEETKEEVDIKEKMEESPVDESPAKMEVDPTESRSDEEQSMTECDLVSNSIVFNCIYSMRVHRVVRYVQFVRSKSVHLDIEYLSHKLFNLICLPLVET